jgi:hypothetical protein
MKTKAQLLKEQIQQVLNEVVKINFRGHQFALKVDTNEDPNKKGLKIQFLPTTFGRITPTEQNDIAIALAEKLDQGLSQYGLQFERDRNLYNKSIIGFFVYIEYFDKIIRKALAQNEPQQDTDQP